LADAPISAPEAAPHEPAPYDHAHHAGNRADVWKHVVLLAVLAARKHEQLRYAETHAGRGRYRPRSGGEGDDGVGRLRALPVSGTGSGALDRYVARLRKEEAGTYPGSPLLAVRALGRRDAAVLHETAPDAAQSLKTLFGGDSRVRVHPTDGWDVAPADVVLVDPPFTDPEDWLRCDQLVARLHAAAPRATLLLWMPIKRWTRPNGVRARLAGVPCVHLDFLWAAPDEGRPTLAGSAMTLVNAPSSALAECLAAAPVLGPIFSPSWSVRCQSQP
jgi:23S rRNA (adenine2030-N6)-methyltransferase